MQRIRGQIRALCRGPVNGALRPFDIRMVDRTWGPCGVFESLKQAKARGLVLQQVVDVGASDGDWTKQCKKVLPDSHVFLVEPLVKYASRLGDLCDTRQNLSYWNGALGSEPGSLDLFAHDGQSSFLRSEFTPASRVERIEVRTLDSFLESGELAPPHFIKADVQGFELEVLRGATKCLESVELVMLEVSYQPIYENGPLAHEVFAALGDWGFHIYDICTYVRRPNDGILAQSDILFARKDSPLFVGDWG